MRPRVRDYLESGLCFAALALLAVAAVWPAVIQGHVPSAAGGVLFYAPWEEARTGGAISGETLDASMQMHRYYPWYAYLKNAHSVQDLLWDPREGGGLPFAALWRTRCLSPFSLPFYLLPIGAAFTLSLVLKLLVAGYSTYHVARRFGYQPPLALLCGATFEFCGYFCLWAGWPVSDVLPWLPLALMFTERLAIGQTQYWAHAALQIGLMALGGDPESLVAALLFLSLFLIVRVVFNLGNARIAVVTGLAFLASVCIGVALAAVQVAPFCEFLTEAANSGKLEPSTSLGLRGLLAAFLPDYFGSNGAVWTADGVTRQTQVLRLLYVGAVSLWMIPLWFAVRRFVPQVQRQRIEAMVCAAAMLTGVAVGLGRIDTLFPISRYLSAEHLLIGNALALALMAGAAAEEWLALNAEECGTAIFRLLFYVPLLALAGAGLWWSQVAPSPSSVWLQIVIHGGLALCVLAVLGVTLLKPSVRLLGYSLTALAAGSLFLVHHPATKFSDPASLFPETAFVKTLHANGGRLSGSEALKRWPLAGNMLPQVYSPAGMQLRRHASFLERAQVEPFLLRRTGAQYLLLTKNDIQGTFAAIRPMLAIQHVFPSGAVLFKDLGAKPRAWVTYEGRGVETFEPAALSATLPPLIEGAAPPASATGPEAQVALTPATTSTKVEVAVDSTRPGILVLADAYYPGWEATVNNESVEIFPVDGMFRGVQIKEGKSQVVFQYNPMSLRIGAGISLAAAVILAAKWMVAAFHLLRGRLKRA